MRTFVALVATLLSATAVADSDILVIAANREAVVPSVSIMVPAEYVVLPISISSDDKDPIKNLDLVATARAKLVEAVGKQPTIKLRSGVVAIRISEAEDSFSYSESGYPSSSADTHLVYRLEKKTQFQAAREMMSVVRPLLKMDEVRFRFGVTALAVDDPERYRAELLALIAKDVERTRATLKSARSFEVRGLENRVSVVPYDDTNVIVFIPYKMSISQ